MQLLYLDPRSLEADPQGVRDDPGNVDGLAATISEHGLLQPLGVLEAGQGRYRVVYGNRRREAAVQLGLERVPCIILDADDPHTLIQQLTENVQRQDLNDLEKARAFQRLREQLQANQPQNEGDLDEATARTVGLSARTIRRYLGLLDLPEEIQTMLRAGDLSVTQAQHLRRIPNERTQVELARAAVDEGMSAAELSRLSSYFAANPNLSLDDALSSLDQMLDETDRLARAHVEGDLVKWVKSDSGAPMKVRLLLKQVESLARALRQVANQQGW